MNIPSDMDYIVVNPPPDTLQADIIDIKNPPLVSFCIPTKNNEDTLESCLSSIVDQDYPNIEIVIIDGKSTDNTIAIARKFTDKVYSEKGMLGKARQRSLEEAAGSVVALFDSDIIIPHKNWLANMIQYFNYSTDISTVWPYYTFPPGSSRTTRLYLKLWRVITEDRIAQKRSFFGGGNSLFRKECFDSIGGINQDIHWGEDFDWAKKFKDIGYRVVMVDDPIYHDTMHTLKEFYHKQFVGAKTFTQTGFGIMGLSTKEILYENFILGPKAMIRGLFIDRDLCWLYYPLFLGIRILAYSYILLHNFSCRKTE